MSYPKVVALDTDWTIWQWYLDSATWGRGPGAQPSIEDNIERVDRQLLRDRTKIRVFDDISNIVHDILKNGARLAIVSRRLYYFNTINPKNGREWSIIHLVTYDEVIDQSKVQHFKRIRTWSASDFSDLLMFDDEAYNNVVRIEAGVTFQFVRDGKGLTWDVYQQGLDAWRRAKSIMIPSSPSPVRMLVGFSALPSFSVTLIGRGECRVDRNTPSRWGYALYLADTIGILTFYVEPNTLLGWNEEWIAEKSHVYEVWVKDYDAWTSINKIWIPENSGYLPQMNNTLWSVEDAGRNQEDRDRFITDHWKVPTPYMVVYTQIQRSLFEVVRVPDDQVDQHSNPNPYPFDKQIKTWKITVPNETNDE
ncbi:acid phosphatase-domain-containing protein, partial [Russula earlei]